MSPGDELVSAIRVGEVDRVARLLASHDDLASASLGGGRGTQTPLHVVAGWPGDHPIGPEIALLLIRSGAAADALPRAATRRCRRDAVALGGEQRRR